MNDFFRNMTFQLFLDDGDGGGAGAGAGSADQGSSSGGAGSQDQGTALNAGSATGATGGQGGGEPSSDKSQDQPSYEDLQKAYSETQTKFTELSQQVDHLKKKLGQQGNQLAAYNALVKRMESDPQGFISEFAQEKGLKVKTEDGLNSVLQQIGENGVVEAKDLAEVIKMVKEEAVKEARLSLAPEYERVFENQMRQKHPDYEDLAPERQALRDQLLSKDITFNEVLHYAVQGMHLPEALEAAEQRGADKLREELNRKAQGSLSSPGAAGTNVGGGDQKPDDPEYFNKVVAAMRKVRQ